MQGYFEDPERTAETIDADGWLHTGDIGTMDADGYVAITDRKKDMFIVGGFNAYPAEIENLLLAHPDLAQVAVVGVPDERMGEVGVAFVVPDGRHEPRARRGASPGPRSTWPTTRCRGGVRPARRAAHERLATRSSSTSCGTRPLIPDAPSGRR